jgi:hypothetical protein
MKPACRDLRRLSPLTANNTTYAQHSMATLTSTMEGLALDGGGEALITIIWLSSLWDGYVHHHFNNGGERWYRLQSTVSYR